MTDAHPENVRNTDYAAVRPVTARTWLILSMRVTIDNKNALKKQCGTVWKRYKGRCSIDIEPLIPYDGKNSTGTVTVNGPPSRLPKSNCLMRATRDASKSGACSSLDLMTTFAT